MKNILIILFFSLFFYAFRLGIESFDPQVSYISITDNEEDENNSQEYHFQYKKSVLQRITNGSDVHMDYYYNKDNTLKEIIRFSQQNEEDTLTRVTFRYNAENKLNQAFIIQYEEGEPVSKQKIVNLWNDQNQLIKQSVYEEEQDKYVKQKEYFYILESNGNVRSCTIKEYYGKDKYSRKIQLTYSYDKNHAINPMDPVIYIDHYFRPTQSINNPLKVDIKEMNSSNKVLESRTIEYQYVYNASKYPTLIKNNEGLKIEMKY